MLHIDAAPIPAISGEKVDNGNDTLSVKKNNGKYLCVTPQGKLEERDNPGGPWESFKLSGNFLVASRESFTYLLGFAETK